jgi:hypothetical protein
MAAGSWVRSLQCKSMAVVDVAARGAPVPRKLLPRSGCASTGDAHKKTKPSPKPVKKTKPASVPPSPPPGPLGSLPALTELPAGHSSRQVVEIIFLSSWTTPSPQLLPQPPPPAGGAFPGEVEILFRVHNAARSVARFEDYRAADGNEMMRFSPAPPYGPASAADGGDGVDTARVWTFDGSGGAHASARGPATGRRAMFLCRVIAGRVAETGTGSDSSGPGMEHDSLRVGKGELVVLDRRAVLPCFLIIYKL